MKYQKYPAYKDSGVEWIGKIPEHWKLSRIKFVSEVTMGQSPPSDSYLAHGELPFLQGCADFGENFPNPKNYCEVATKISYPGDILLSVRAPVGELNLSDRLYGIGRGLCSIRPFRTGVEYLKWYLVAAKNNLISLSNGSTYDAVTISDVKNLEIPIFKDKFEQNTINEYVNTVTTKIDLLNSKQHNMIELLKEKRQAIITKAVTKGLDPNVQMKDSGVEWIGKIPEHWKLTKLKSVCHFNYGDSLPAEDRLEGEFPVFGSNGIIDYNSLANTGSPTIIIGRKGSYGKLFYSSLSGFAIDTTFFVNEKTSKVNLKWLYYALGILHLDMNSLDTGVPGLSRENAYEEIIVLPSNEEQFLISNFLDSKTNKIDILISKHLKLIDLLKEYKSSLITQAVTGKIDVRGFAASSTSNNV